MVRDNFQIKPHLGRHLGDHLEFLKMPVWQPGIILNILQHFVFPQKHG